MFDLVTWSIKYEVLPRNVRYYLQPLGEDVVPAVEEDGESEESWVLVYPADNRVSQSVQVLLTFTDLGSPSTYSRLGSADI